MADTHGPAIVEKNSSPFYPTQDLVQFRYLDLCSRSKIQHIFRYVYFYPYFQFWILAENQLHLFTLNNSMHDSLCTLVRQLADTFIYNPLSKKAGSHVALTQLTVDNS